MVNLLVDLDERFGPDALVGALRGIENAGYSAAYDATSARDMERLPAWIDMIFGGTWGCEADVGRNVVACSEDEFAGFATYEPMGLRFKWLRGLAVQPGVGIFGPFGVAAEHRGSGVGPHLLTAALAALRECGYDRALIPAVGEEKLVEYYVRHSGARIVESFEKGAFHERRYRTLVLASGSGTNFQAVLDAARGGRLPLDISSLVCNRSDAVVLERARAASIPATCVVWDRSNESRAAYDARLLEVVSQAEPDLVLLLGWMHLFDETFVRTFGDRAINIHPAYLPLDQNAEMVTCPGRTGGDEADEQPAFRGAHAVRDALNAGAKWTGATAHELSVGADRGRVLVRKPVRLPAGADLDAAMTLLRPVEHKVVAGGIMRWIYER